MGRIGKIFLKNTNYGIMMSSIISFSVKRAKIVAGIYIFPEVCTRALGQFTHYSPLTPSLIEMNSNKTANIQVQDCLV